MSNVGCCVKECTNSYCKAVKQGKVLTLYSFPSKPWLKERREIWIKFATVGREHADGSPCVLKKNWKICNEHFVGGTKSEDPRHPAYNPTIRNPREPPKQDPKVLIDRYKRVVERHNLKKRKEKELQENEAVSKKAEVKTVTLNVPKGVKVVINQVGDKLTQEDHPTDSGLSPEHEPLEKEPDKGKPVEFGPKQLTCLICCEATNQLDKSFSDNLYFQRFCRILYPFYVERRELLASLNQFSYLSICQPCLSAVSCIAVKKSGIDKCAEKVKNLQSSLIQELKSLHSKMEGFYQEIRKVEQRILEADLETKLEENNDKPNNLALRFREKIVKNSRELKKFGGYLNQKIRCDDKDKVPDEPDIVNLEVEIPVQVQEKEKPSSSEKPMECYSNLKGGGVIRRAWIGGKWKIIERTQPPTLPPGVKRPYIFREDLRVECNLCKKKIHKHFLQKHKSISCRFAPGWGRKEGICHLCGKRFTSGLGLEKHVKYVHSEDRPFLCSRCPFASKTLHYLRIHEGTHDGLRKYVCRKGCGGGFRNGRNRKTHEDHCDGRGTPFRKKAKLVEPPKEMVTEK